MKDKIKLYIVDPNSNFIDSIEGLFFEKDNLGITVIGSATTSSFFEKDKQKISQADIYLVSASLPDGTGIKIIEFLKKNSVTSSKPIIFTIDKQTRNHASIAKEKGVSKIFQKPFSMKDLIQVIYTLTNPTTNPVESPSSPVETIAEQNTTVQDFEMNSPLKNANPKNESNTHFSPEKQNDLYNKVETSPLLNTRQVETTNQSTNQIKKSIVTFSSVSSTGKTSILVNTAYAIQKYAKVKPKICLVDLNLLFPSVAFHFLNTELKIASRDIYDISADLNYLNEDLLKEALTYHEPTGIHMLNIPSEPEFIHKIGTINSEHLERILVHLRDMFDVLLIDTSNAITEDLVLFPVQFADKNIVVMEPNYLNVVGVNKFFYVLKQLEDSMKEPIISKTHILLNKETKNKSIYTETARDFLYDKKFITRIPDDEKFIDFANKGKFIVDSESVATSSILDLANFIYPINPSDGKKKSRFSFKKK